MNILIQFEDLLGCHSLFLESKAFLNLNVAANSLVIRPGRSNSNVFQISKADAAKYDIIFCIFDLDALDAKGLPKDVALNEDNFYANLLKKGLVDNTFTLKTIFKNKVFFIPVEFCYETIPLYSNYLINILNNIDNYKDTKNTRVLKMLKTYYDYSRLHPEYFDGAAHVAEEIHKNVCNITGDAPGQEWKAQQIHLSFSKNLLTLYFRENGYYLESDSVCRKSETKLFELMDSQKTGIQPSNIIEDFYNKAIINKLFARLLVCDSLAELNNICADATLSNALNVINTYNQIVKKPFIKHLDLDLKLCKANIDTMLGYGVRSTNKIIKTLLKQGFSQEIIDKALDELTE